MSVDERIVTCPYCGFDCAVIRLEGVEYIDHKAGKVFGFTCAECGMHGLHRGRNIDQVYKEIGLQAMEKRRAETLRKARKK